MIIYDLVTSFVDSATFKNALLTIFVPSFKTIKNIKNGNKKSMVRDRSV